MRPSQSAQGGALWSRLWRGVGPLLGLGGGGMGAGRTARPVHTLEGRKGDPARVREWTPTVPSRAIRRFVTATVNYLLIGRESFHELDGNEAGTLRFASLCQHNAD